jgi:hypothetical protein
MTILAVVFGGMLLAILGTQYWRWTDKRRATRAWIDLARPSERAPPGFTPAMVAELPDPARRYFLFAIRSGTRLRNIAEIRMSGEIGLAERGEASYLPMRAQQLLAPPHGLVWNLAAGSGVVRLGGSDVCHGKRSWSRFWLLGTFPVARAGGGRDHWRAAFGRVVAEAVIWVPATLLPRDGVSWEQLSTDSARATVSYNGVSQTVDVTVAADGRPIRVVIPRWTDANPSKTYQLQPFGGYLSEFQEFEGYRLPTRVEGGNFIGTDNYFPFYKVNIEALRFI